MPKLIVDSPKGVQQIIQVHETGGYFDLSRVLWDERIDGPIPSDAEVNLGGIVRVGKDLAYDALKKEAEVELLSQRNAEKKALKDEKEAEKQWIETLDLDANWTAAVTQSVVKKLVKMMKRLRKDG